MTTSISPDTVISFTSNKIEVLWERTSGREQPVSFQHIVLPHHVMWSLSEIPASLSGSRPQFTNLISPPTGRETNLTEIKPLHKLQVFYCIAASWQNMGDYFFSPVKFHALENFKELFDDWVKQFYSRLNWLITSSYNNGLCFYPKETLSIHLRIAKGLMHHTSKAGNWDRLPA